MISGQLIYLLIGPKGSGKSYIGEIMEAQLAIRFLRVESWVKDLKKERTIHDESYIREVFQVIERGVRDALKTHKSVVFESTGLTAYFDQMFTRLSHDFKIITIKVMADPKLCLTRVKTRDQNIHINVSDDQVLKINSQVLEKDRSCDFEIENNDLSDTELGEKLKVILSEI